MIRYTEIFDNIPGKGFSDEAFSIGFVGCNCESNCELECPCKIFQKNNQGYTELGELKVNPSDPNWNLYPITECNINCECDENDCINRLVQNGCRFKLERKETVNKGFGLYTKDLITAGSFVIAYLGEVINRETAEIRIEERKTKNEPNYIMSLIEYYLNDGSIETTIIDARDYGCQARYINHSCEPNLCIIPVRINSIIPQAALFALREIQVNEELSYDYNGSIDKQLSKNIDLEKIVEDNKSEYECFCGSTKCRGYLPTNKY